jgi:hypothetical protein
MSDYKKQGVVRGRCIIIHWMDSSDARSALASIYLVLSAINASPLHHNQKCLQNPTASKTKEKTLPKHDK